MRDSTVPTDPLQPAGARIPWPLGVVAAAVLLGFGALEVHSRTAGVAARPPQRVEESAAHPRLFVFLHPECPCSRASLAELARIAERTEGAASMQAFVISDPAFDGSVRSSDPWRRAAAIPGCVVEEDPDGVRARAFGAETSGTILLYARDGTLLFEGGITASRGHEGGNSAADALAERILGRSAEHVATPVFGCSLLGAAGSV